MAKCSHCNKFIFGGKKQGALRFCNDACYQKGFLGPVAEAADPDLLAERVKQLYQQTCPICDGDGPVDVCTSHTAWSFIYITSWKDHPQLSCASCGKKAIWRGIAFTSICGWWGFPFGLVTTPWQLLNGFKSLKKLPNLSGPSEELQQTVKMDFVAELLQSANSSEADSSSPSSSRV